MNKSKYALIITCNYKGTSAQLNGCNNDGTMMRNYLTTQRGYKIENIVTLADDTDSKPTHDNILKALNDLVNKSPIADELWLHYSGHGTYVKDKNGDEADGRDECLVPMDYEESGYIVDDKLNIYIKKVTCPLICIFDCCHSGTILDLKYHYNGNNYNVIQNNNINAGTIITISGCKDTQTSADAFIDGQYAGAMTSAFLDTMRTCNYKTTAQGLIEKMRIYMKRKNYTQIPQICSSFKLSDTYVFP